MPLNAVHAHTITILIIIPNVALLQEENLGRYNVRLHEGNGWRSVFLDDRLPCSPQYVRCIRELRGMCLYAIIIAFNTECCYDWPRLVLSVLCLSGV